MSDRSGSSNTAIVAILVILLVVVIGFFVFTGQGGEAVPDEPDIEIEIAPGDGGGDGGTDGA
ncbi:MAG: hypothetical protein R3247_16305 [Rhodothermales bacterium]|nr:hypothetical protein [Rhodothermales bacterium]